MTVTEAVLLELERYPDELRDSSLAAAALALAESVDWPDSSTSRAMCVKELRETMDRMRELAPRSKEASPLDEIRARREQRRVRVSNSKNRGSSSG